MDYNNIIFFDGVCNLCNATVDFIISRDKNRVFKFASLQSEFGQKFLEKYNLSKNNFNTVIYYKDNKIFKKSEAFIEILKDLSKSNHWVIFLKFIPRRFRDFIYDRISENRYLIFGKKETCRLATPEERQQFLE